MLNILDPLSSSFDPDTFPAFATTYLPGGSNVFAHELGHLMGLNHDRGFHPHRPQRSPHFITDTRGPRQPSSRLIRTHGAGCRLVVPWFHDYGGAGVRRRRMDNPYESIERHPSVSH